MRVSGPETLCAAFASRSAPHVDHKFAALAAIEQRSGKVRLLANQRRYPCAASARVDVSTDART
jgi:hypothetical protein